jgi:DNA-binding GntR family transcriptional regulator
MSFDTRQEPSDATGTGLNPVLQRPLRDTIYQQLLDRIVSGAIPPGTKLVETELAAKLGTSRIPVREALQELAKDRWVHLRPRLGAWVHVPEPREIIDVFGVRGALESEASRLAAASATQDDIENLTRVVGQARELLAAGKFASIAPLNAEFHRTLTAICGNELLSTMVAGLEARIQWYFVQIAPIRSLESWDEHAQILEAIAGKKADLAAELMRVHTEETCSEYSASYAVLQRERSDAG